MRFALQCLAAAFASLALPVAGAVWILASAPVLIADGDIDDAPERAAMLFLFASPVLLVVLVILFAGSAALLRYVGRLSLSGLLLLDLLVALAVAIPSADEGYDAFGARDAVISFTGFGLLAFAGLALGSTTWWLLRPRCP